MSCGDQWSGDAHHIEPPMSGIHVFVAPVQLSSSIQEFRESLLDRVLPSRLTPFSGELGDVLGKGLDSGTDQDQPGTLTGLRELPFRRTETGESRIFP